MSSKRQRTLAVIDLETDPFEFGAVLAPFAAGCLIEGHGYVHFWGDQCTDRLMSFLADWPEPLVVYAHNGGKFDFYFLLEHLENPVKVIHGRVARAKFRQHEFRDSYCILPTSLQSFDKGTIDYRKLKRAEREANRAEILAYLRQDCEELFRLVKAFREQFGDKLTIAGTAMAELQKDHPQTFLGPGHDARFREFYFGGRVEFFAQGVLRGRWRVFDVNSMYPSVMRNAWHPQGRDYLTTLRPELTAHGWIRGYPWRLYFAEVEGVNHGALPVRTKDGLSFQQREGVFHTTSHELVAAIRLGRFEVRRVNWAMLPDAVQRFDTFVDRWAARKLAAEKAGDAVGRYFAKTIPNSSYGKFGQDPSTYQDYFLELFAQCRVWTDVQREGVRGMRVKWADGREEFKAGEWDFYESHPAYRVYRKPAAGFGAYRDVAIAASITSAARAVLMRALAAARRPVYCDTDSIICEGLGAGAPQHPSALGAWKLEAKGDRIAVAGKKLYALFDGRECVKAASKGVKITPQEIERVAKGGEVLWQSDAPNFSLLHGVRYVQRRVKRR